VIVDSFKPSTTNFRCLGTSVSAMSTPMRASAPKRKKNQSFL
jgi:hypothetical protein